MSRIGAVFVRGLASAVFLVAVAAAPLAAQQQNAEEKSPRERVLERLRALSRPDTAVTDSALIDTVRVRVPAADSGRTAPAAPIMTRDSLVEALLGLEGFIATEYKGTGARFTSDSGRVELVGKAEVLRDGQSMTADSLLVYDLDQAKICGYGKPTMAGGDASPVSSETVCYDIERRLGVAHGARTAFDQGAKWYVTGQETYFVGNDKLYSHNALFTDCDLEDPHYHFKAGQVKMVREDIMVARNVTLNFKDVPVFWLPFVMQSMKQGRRSGILMPDFSVNDIARTSRGYNRRIGNLGAYWAINDYLGMKVAGEWFAGNYTSVDGSFDYRLLQHFLDGYLNVRRYWREEGGTELTFSTNNRWQPGERTSVNMDARYTSSSDFVRRNTFNPLELNRSIDSNVALSHRFDWGSLSAGGRRRQFLTDERVEMELPSLSLTLQSITLFAAPQTQASWYNNATWTGNASASASSTSFQTLQAGERYRDSRAVRGAASSSFNLGNLQWSQQFDLNESRRLAKAAFEEDTALPEAATQQMTWSSTLNYQQRLMGTSTFTPRLSLRGAAARTPDVGNQLVTAPVRMDFGADLRTDVYGFWPGVGAFSRIRHKLSPSIGYTYSPEIKADSLQRAALSSFSSDARQQNQIRIGLNQTFEAKRAVSDTAAADTAAVESGRPGEPRRRPQAEKLMLLSINTSALAYDFVRASEDTIGGALPGLVEPSISNSISSDLLRGLSLSFRHDLFDTPVAEDGKTRLPRRFSPHLSDVSADFSIGSDSWLVKALRFGRDKNQPAEGQQSQEPVAAEAGSGVNDPTGQGMIGGNGTSSFGGTPMGSIGTWNAQVSYSLVRPRQSDLAGLGGQSGLGGSGGSQMVRGSLSLQPTERWRMAWNTAYSITDREFADHMLTLTRDLHEWQANFDFVKAQNGNFSFQFRVALKSTPDLKVEYDQRGQRGGGFGDERRRTGPQQ